MAMGSGSDERKWELDLSDAAVRGKDAILEAYNESFQRLKAALLREKFTPDRKHGHLPGVKPGDSYPGRGELCILGLHRAILAGIDWVAKDVLGAYAIVLSGGYKDDQDEGTTFWYTGQGGQGPGGVQVTDQKWERGNLALKHSSETGTPVRVFRGGKHGTGKVITSINRRYVYDGLYLVKEAKMEPSSDGPQVCKFLMVGMDQQSQASEKVEFGALGKGGRCLKAMAHGVRLALEGKESRPKKKKVVSDCPDALATARLARISALSQRKGLLLPDLSFGKERVPIPLFNETGNGQGPPEGVDYIADYQFAPGVEELTYVPDYQFAPGVEELVEDVLKEQSDAFVNSYMGGRLCALDFNKHMVKRDRELTKQYESYRRTTHKNYSDEGLLLSTDAFGVVECLDTCGRSCRHNKRVSQGVQLPLEVYMTETKGWGVRCDVDILAGDYVVSYIGELITEVMAEGKGENGQYLFSLDHFSGILQEAEDVGDEKMLQEVGDVGAEKTLQEVEEVGAEQMYRELPEYKMPPPPPKFINAGIAKKSSTLSVA
eukprot:gene13694-19586_t